MMKKLLSLFISIAVVAIAIILLSPGSAKAYSNGRLINDNVFDSASSMSTADIQAFLNKFPNACLKNYTDVYPVDYFTYTTPVSAATIIRRAADLWGINPRVIIAKLQQEESLITGSDCAGWRYNSAMGMGCPDGGACPAPAYAGFSRQVTKGSWLLKFAKERANGNMSWLVPDDAAYNYTGPTTQGNRRVNGSSPLVYHDGYWNGVLLETGATASLYNYTPHIPSSFPAIYESFFGAGSATASPYPPNIVFRLYNPQNNEHFFTAAEAEKNILQSIGFTYEGFAYYQGSGPSVIPVYRLYHSRIQKHFYTTSAAERDYAVSKLGFVYERIDHYVNATPAPGRVPVYRITNPPTGDHHYTISTAERDYAIAHLGYIDEGISWYAN